MILKGSHKFDFLTGEIPQPPLDDSQEHFWKEEDFLIRAMLINSMKPQIDKSLLYAVTAKDIWDTTRKLYLKHQNASHHYTLRKQVHKCKNCPSDGIQNSKLKEVDRIYVFLASLNSKFDQVRGRVLGQRPFPSLMEVCSEVCLEEDRTSAMNILTTLAIDSVAFSVTSSTHDSEKHNGKPVPIYEHYKK
ncbi:Beta-galactosidase [Cucumis melo var. makuwa]|uniref:Beta-galactosidase n=1 Tax=Cucumis melo var. makuwa TaxID=1194695 RepID=A0A5A7TLY2_CUCMM|nr:Beta-galactosidase [Cucumis melo var. makuwa]TYK03507.1 Beta-galactosidase [Cucumis melo var. makuwa]